MYYEKRIDNMNREYFYAGNVENPDIGRVNVNKAAPLKPSRRKREKRASVLYTHQQVNSSSHFILERIHLQIFGASTAAVHHMCVEM